MGKSFIGRMKVKCPETCMMKQRGYIFTGKQSISMQ